MSTINPNRPFFIHLVLISLVANILISAPFSCHALHQQKNQENEKIFTLNDLEFLIDTSNVLTFSQVSKLETQHFIRDAFYKNKDFDSDFTYWIKFPVWIDPQTSGRWMIEFYDQTIDSLLAYLPTINDQYQELVMGDHLVFNNRQVPHKNFGFILKESSTGPVVYYFKVRSHEFADIRIAFRQIDRFIDYALIEYMLFGIFYGMILIITLYNFLMLLAMREMKYLYYMMYLLAVAGYAFSLDGIGFQYLWPNHPRLNDYSSGIFLYMVILTALLFTRSFLNTKINSKKLDRLLLLLIVVRSIMFVFAMTGFPNMLSNQYLEVTPLLVIFYTGISVWYKGYRPARFFVIAYGVLFLGFFLRSLVYFNVVPFTILSHYSLHLSFVFEMLFLTFALGDRVRFLKDNRDRALRRIIQQNEINLQLQDKVNRELEDKVNDRTVQLNQKNHELVESNDKLIRQAKEINQINSLLDLDNWKLKNRIKEVLNERFMDKLLDYDEFKTIYPNELSCYRFLESLKWDKEFHCRKCDNKKYFKGSRKFSRRCTKCGYNESITSHTIFKSIKFPIEKAFFIAYLEVSGKKEMTLEQLASLLGLGVNAVWSFKHKVILKIEQLLSFGIEPDASQWEIICLDIKMDRKGKMKKYEKNPSSIV